jgi:hypothetical protein
VFERDCPSDLRPHGAILGCDSLFDLDMAGSPDRVAISRQNPIVDRFVRVSDADRLAANLLGCRLGEERREIEQLGPAGQIGPLRQQIGASHDFVDRARAERGEHLAYPFRQQREVVRDHLRRAGELRAQLFFLGGDTGRAAIQMALSRHIASKGD